MKQKEKISFSFHERESNVSRVNMCGKEVVFLILCVTFPETTSMDFWKLIDKKNESSSLMECLSDTMKVLDGLNKKEMWAMKIVDASTKFPSGILTGHIVDYGNYDECLDNDPVNMPTRHCFAHYRFDNVSFPADVSLKLSYCVPESCSPEVLQDILQDILQSFLKDVNVSVNTNECTTNRVKPLATADYIGIAFWGFFIGLAILSTTYDVFCRTMANVNSNPMLASFSLYTNGLRLFNAKTTSGTMMPLHGLRFLSICWVILGHRCFFTAFSSLLNLTELLKVLNEVHAQLFIQGVLAVDTFFLLSGLLNSYNLLMILDKTKKFPFGIYYIHRYIRLTPVLAAIVVMYATWYERIGDGPNWSQMTNQWKDLCVNNWWPTLLYINNYYNPTSQCAGQSWYLAVDVQLYWLSPLIILPLWKRPKLGKIVLVIVFLASIAIVFTIAFLNEFRAPFSAGFEGMDEFIRTTEILYVPTHTRATPYLVGLMLGYYLHFLKKNKTILVLSKGLLVFGWLTTSAVCLTIIFGNYEFMRPIAEHPYNQVESSFYISLHRVGWSFGISWIIICCINKMGGIISDILSLKIFVPLSRLTYCIFLCHMAIQQYQVGTARTPDYFQYFNQLHRFFGDLFSAVIFATFLTLIFESPILTLEKLLTKTNDVKIVRGESNGGFEEDDPVQPVRKDLNFVL